jgi:hypothetical protein
VEFAPGPAHELLRIQDEIESEKIILANAPPPSSVYVDERVDDPEQRRLDAAGCKLGPRAKPVAKEVLLAEILAHLVDGGLEWFAEQILRVFSRLLPVRGLDVRRSG